MTVWVLFIIFLDSEQYYVQPNSVYQSYDDCKNSVAVFMKTAPQPQINYDAVCIKTDQVTMQ